ncbi:hypothetical protein ACW5CM_08300 [Microbacterium sp. A588]
MDQAILIYLLLAIVIVLPVVGLILKRKARRAGAQRWEAKKDRQAGDDGLGATITFAADEATVRVFAAPLIEGTKRVRTQDDGTWAQTHYNDDDVVYQLVSTAEGTTLGVSRAIEFSGTLNGMKAWKKLREQIVAAAAEREIAVTTGNRPLVRTADASPTGAVIWRPAA